MPPAAAGGGRLAGGGIQVVVHPQQHGDEDDGVVEEVQLHARDPDLADAHGHGAAEEEVFRRGLVEQERVLEMVPELDAEGVYHWFGQIVDTTLDKQRELELEESRITLKRAQEIAELGYWKANFATGELYWSDKIYEIFHHFYIKIEFKVNLSIFSVFRNCRFFFY